MSPYCPTYPLSNLPLVSSFGRGKGTSVSINGKVIKLALTQCGPYILYRLFIKGYGQTYQHKIFNLVLLLNFIKMMQK